MGKKSPVLSPLQTTPRVIIAVPCSDSAAMKARTANAIGCTIIRSGGIVVDFLLRMSCDIVSNRTQLVRQAIDKGATHILFVDCDMFFPAETLTQLLSHGKAIVGVEYNKREFPLTGVYKPLTEKADTLYKADHVGTGLLLVDLNVFKTMTGAWFSFGRDSQGALVIGEDVWFCKSAQDVGYDVWIDPSIKVGHIGEYMY